MTGKIEQWVRSAYYQGDDPGTAAKTIALLSAAAKWDAEIEALTRRNAELTAAILDYHLFHHGLRREITECAGRLCRRYAALTPTESEATNDE